MSRSVFLVACGDQPDIDSPMLPTTANRSALERNLHSLVSERGFTADTLIVPEDDGHAVAVAAASFQAQLSGVTVKSVPAASGDWTCEAVERLCLNPALATRRLAIVGLSSSLVRLAEQLLAADVVQSGVWAAAVGAQHVQRADEDLTALLRGVGTVLEIAVIETSALDEYVGELQVTKTKRYHQLTAYVRLCRSLTAVSHARVNRVVVFAADERNPLLLGASEDDGPVELDMEQRDRLLRLDERLRASGLVAAAHCGPRSVLCSAGAMTRASVRLLEEECGWFMNTSECSLSTAFSVASALKRVPPGRDIVLVVENSKVQRVVLSVLMDTMHEGADVRPLTEDVDPNVAYTLRCVWMLEAPKLAASEEALANVQVPESYFLERTDFSGRSTANDVLAEFDLRREAMALAARAAEAEAES